MSYPETHLPSYLIAQGVNQDSLAELPTGLLGCPSTPLAELPRDSLAELPRDFFAMLRQNSLAGSP